MITDAHFPLFARRKRTASPLPRNLKETRRGRHLLHLLRRREVTTFQKGLAVHMYYAAPKRIGR